MEGTWGIGIQPRDDWGDDMGMQITQPDTAKITSTVSQAADAIKIQQQSSVDPNTGFEPQNLESQVPQTSSEIDTSFLDDLL